MTQRTLDDVFKTSDEFFGGQVEFNHLGDTYRGEIDHFTREGGSVFIWLKWSVIWYDDAWRTQDEGFHAVEVLAGHSLETQEDGGYRFTPFIFRHGVLYPKGHKSNVEYKALGPAPLL